MISIIDCHNFDHSIRPACYCDDHHDQYDHCHRDHHHNHHYDHSHDYHPHDHHHQLSALACARLGATGQLGAAGIAAPSPLLLREGEDDDHDHEDGELPVG